MQEEARTEAAFSGQSAAFDVLNENNPIVVWVRRCVRNEVQKYLHSGMQMLELNCGTGLDALYFASLGADVCATDLSEGMITALRQKIAVPHAGQITAKRMSFHDSAALGDTKFDYVFSDFGGLNCTAHLDEVLRNIGTWLKPGGYCTLVIMPKFCPWELLAMFRGHFRLAFRRFRKGGTPAKIHANAFTCYYYNPSYIRRHLPGFSICSLRGLCITVPPPHHAAYVLRYPRLMRFLKKTENAICRLYPFNRWGDHFMITLQKKIQFEHPLG